MLLCVGAGMAACGEFEVGGKKAADVFGDEQLAALARAASQGDLAGMDAAIADGADVNDQGLDGTTILEWSLYAENKPAFEKLYKAGADPYLMDSREMNVVVLATRVDDPGYLEILLENGLDPNKPADEDKFPPIFSAVFQARWPQIDLLLAHCYNLNWADSFGRTAAVEDTSIGYPQIAVYLVENGLTHNLRRLMRTVDRIRVGKDQQPYKEQLIAMLKERGEQFPPDSRQEARTPPPPSPPVYAASCQS
jgi:ankyrin repeat protein